jgi:hypothetical protein
LTPEQWLHARCHWCDAASGNKLMERPPIRWTAIQVPRNIFILHLETVAHVLAG